ncbi:MAG: hypothetical protein R3E10_00870 [Gemmatimonadota bacterium]
MSSSRKTVLIVGLLAFATGGHAFIQSRLSGGKALYVSKLEPGERVRDLASLEVVDLKDGTSSTLLTGSACEAIVVFASVCPFCHEAAVKEARRGDGLAVPTVWVSDTDDPGAREFRELVHKDSRVVFQPDIKKVLAIQAVPAVVLIRNGEEVLDVWPYRGNDKPERFEKLCTSSVAS